MPTLLLRLVGPMQSWGTTSRFDDGVDGGASRCLVIPLGHPRTVVTSSHGHVGERFQIGPVLAVDPQSGGEESGDLREIPPTLSGGQEAGQLRLIGDLSSTGATAGSRSELTRDRCTTQGH